MICSNDLAEWNDSRKLDLFKDCGELDADDMNEGGWNEQWFGKFCCCHAQAKKEEVPAEEEKNKVPQPDRTEHDAKV